MAIQIVNLTGQPVSISNPLYTFRAFESKYFPGRFSLTSELTALDAAKTLQVEVIDNARNAVFFNASSGALETDEGPVVSVGNASVLPGSKSQASKNAAACRTALRNGLLRIAEGLGTVYVSGTLAMPSYARLEVGAGTRLKAADGRAQPLITTKYSANIHASSLMTRSGGVCNVTETGTWREQGDQLFITGGPDATYRGLVPITLRSDGNGFTYPSPGTDGTAGTSGQFYNFIPVRRVLDATAFTAIGGGYVNVADADHDLQPGDQLYLGSVAGNVFGPGIVKVTRVADGQWTYYAAGATGSAAGTYVVSYDKDITIEGDGYIDGNRTGASTDPGNDMRQVTVSIGCVNGVLLDCKIGGSAMRGVNAYNCAAVSLGKRWAPFDNLVGFQAEGGVDGCLVDQGDVGDSQMYAGYPASVSIVSATNNGTTAIITTATPHRLTKGTPVRTTGFTPAAYNSSTAQIVVDSPTQFRYTMASNPGGAATVIGSYTAGQQADDYIAFTGTAFANGAAGNYDSTISPYGLTYFAGIEARSLFAANALNAIKMTAMASCPFKGTVRIGRVTCRNLDDSNNKGFNSALRFMDDGPGLVGTKADRIQIDGPIEFFGTANAVGAGTIATIQGAGTIDQLVARGYSGELGNSAAIMWNGVTINHLDVSGCRFTPLGTNKPALQFLSGLVRKLSVKDSTAKVGASQPLMYLGGATVHDIELSSIVVDSETAGQGTLIDYSVAASVRSITMRGMRTPVGGTFPSSIMAIQNIAVGTLDVLADDCDVQSASFITTPGTAGSGTINVHLGSRFRWTATGGNNLLQAGFGTWSLFGAPGVAVPSDKLSLFGYGAPTYRIHMPSDRASVNINSGNYIGGQMVPVNGDQLYNNNAGALAVGPVVRRAGAWAAL